VKVVRPTLEDGYLRVLAAARAAAESGATRAACPATAALPPRRVPPRASASAFLRGLRWELEKLWRRPRTYAGFAVCLLFDVTLALLIRLPAVREVMARRFWKTPIDLEQALTGLTVATHLLAETAALVGALFVCFVVCDIVGREFEDGTIRMVLSRPVGRTSVWAQKLIAAVVFTVGFTLFIGAVALVVGLVAEGVGGKLYIYEPRESILGILPFPLGLARYGAAVGFLVVSMQMITVLAFALACLPLKPGTAAVLAFAILLADNLIRFDPGLVAVSPYTISTRFLTYRQVFNEQVQWLRVQRNFGFQLRFDVALLALAWWVFRRREIR
jgi:ABC-2 type transport system permease protein